MIFPYALFLGPLEHRQSLKRAGIRLCGIGSVSAMRPMKECFNVVEVASGEFEVVLLYKM